MLEFDKKKGEYLDLNEEVIFASDRFISTSYQQKWKTEQ